LLISCRSLSVISVFFGLSSWPMTDSTSCPPCRAPAALGQGIIKPMSSWPMTYSKSCPSCRARAAAALSCFGPARPLHAAGVCAPASLSEPQPTGLCGARPCAKRVTLRRRAAAGGAGRARLRLGVRGVQVVQRHVLDHLLLLVHVALRARATRPASPTAAQTPVLKRCTDTRASEALVLHGQSMGRTS